MLRSASSKRLSTAVASRVNNTSVRCIQGKPGDVASGNSSFAKKVRKRFGLFDTSRIITAEDAETSQYERRFYAKSQMEAPAFLTYLVHLPDIHHIVTKLKEKALEDMFFRQQDAARLKKLREHPELLEAEKNKFVKTKLSEEKGGSAGKH